MLRLRISTKITDVSTQNESERRWRRVGKIDSRYCIYCIPGVFEVGIFSKARYARSSLQKNMGGRRLAGVSEGTVYDWFGVLLVHGNEHRVVQGCSYGAIRILINGTLDSEEAVK